MNTFNKKTLFHDILGYFHEYVSRYIDSEIQQDVVDNNLILTFEKQSIKKSLLTWIATTVKTIIMYDYNGAFMITFNIDEDSDNFIVTFFIQ